MESQTKLKLNYPRTLLTGFGLLGISVLWTFYMPMSRSLCRPQMKAPH